MGERERRRGKVRRGRTKNNFITNSDHLIELTNVVGKAVSQHHGRYKITGEQIICNQLHQNNNNIFNSPS